VAEDGARERAPLLEVKGLQAGFGAGPVLFGVDMEIAEGELVAMIGANGAGKSTLLGVLSGLVRPMAGRVLFRGKDITGARPERVVNAGMMHVPQSRRLFATISVERVLGYFPALQDKLARDAGTLSGGEQQMVAIGRGLMGRPRLLMIDEPSLGLAPKVVETVIEVAAAINRDGTSVLLVEQDVLVALEAADRGYVLENGRVVLSGPAARLREDPAVRRAYLGV
jgi:branched-chain amino acid transport system ATP-binding protein